MCAMWICVGILSVYYKHFHIEIYTITESKNKNLKGKKLKRPKNHKEEMIRVYRLIYENSFGLAKRMAMPSHLHTFNAVKSVMVKIFSLKLSKGSEYDVMYTLYDMHNAPKINLTSVTMDWMRLYSI